MNCMCFAASKTKLVECEQACHALPKAVEGCTHLAQHALLLKILLQLRTCLLTSKCMLYSPLHPDGTCYFCCHLSELESDYTEELSCYGTLDKSLDDPLLIH